MLSSNVVAKSTTDTFGNDTDSNEGKTVRIVPMKVLALSLGRTGTASLKKALERLGYIKCYHMFSAVKNPPECKMWCDALSAKYDGVGHKFSRKEWDRLLGDCQAVSDWPACVFASELIEAYPNAKVILTLRDFRHENPILENLLHSSSVMKTLYWRTYEDLTHKFLYRFGWRTQYHRPLLVKLFETLFQGDFPDRGKQVYLEHLEKVRSLVPKERLLEFNVKDGWEPLCEFLNEEIPPDTPFPSENSQADYVNIRIAQNKHLKLKAATQIFALVCALVIGMTVLFNLFVS